MLTGQSIEKGGVEVAAPASQIWEGIKDVFRHWWLFLRCSLFGIFIGAVPGVGGDVAVWLAYGHAKMTSKHPERFGLGAVEGVIAPESCSNGKEGGGLLPTLAFGIPGSAAMAVLLGALLILGIEPGPNFLRNHLDLAFTIVGALIISNVLGAGVCILISTQLVKITRIRAQFLVPVILCVTVLGAFCARNNIFDVFLMLSLTPLGWGMKALGYSRPAFFLGFVLGGLAERYFDISLGTYGWTFFLTPISLTLIGITVFGVIFQPAKEYMKRRRAAR